MTEADEPTVKSPNAPKRGRPKKQSTPAESAILALQQQVAALTAQLNKAPVVSEEFTAGPEVQVGQTPGEYVEDGKDAATGRPVFRKRRWSRAEIERRYEAVTFTPMITMPVKPHGITKGGWELTAGQTVTVPSIVKDLYQIAMDSIVRQTAAYPGATAAQEKDIFDAALKAKGLHYTPVKHVGFGWSESALVAAANGTIDPSHEPELGFPAGEAVKV